MTDIAEITKILIKITSIDDDGVDFIALLSISDDGYAHLQRRRSDAESIRFIDIRYLISSVAKVGDYVYYTTNIVPGTLTAKIDLVEDISYNKRIFEDFENNCLLDSYTSYIRDFKLEKIINEK